MTVTILSWRTSRAAGCVLVALLCILTTALFAVADAAVPSRMPVDRHAERVISSENSRPHRIALAAERAVADSDNPFEEGRLAVGEPTPLPSGLISGRPGVAVAADPPSADRPRPERPPRA